MRAARKFWPAALLAAALAIGCAAPDDRGRARYWTARLAAPSQGTDHNRNGFPDARDYLEGGRREVRERTVYRSRYYPRGGYPPAGEGVCTDLLWRALAEAGYSLKDLMDADIAASPDSYPRVAGRPDPAIDFRRVVNQKVFFERHGRILTTVLIPEDPENLRQWRAGDIVTFRETDHVALISDRRNARGLPYLLHNPGPRPVERDDLEKMYFQGRLTGHYRYPPADDHPR